MNETIQLVRQKFESETDILIEPYPEHWKKYALWLEQLAVKELNNQIEKENLNFKNRMQQAIDILEKGLEERV